MAGSDRGQKIHQQFQQINLKLEDCLHRYELATTGHEHHQITLEIFKYRVLLYWNNIQKYFWLKSRGYTHDQIRHWLKPF